MFLVWWAVSTYLPELLVGAEEWKLAVAKIILFGWPVAIGSMFMELSAEGSAGKAAGKGHFYLSLVVAIAGIIFLLVAKPLISIFGVSAQTESWTFQIIVLYTIGTILLYPGSFSTPSALRGTGDTKFVMVVAAASMFLFRIGCAYVCVRVFNFGVVGIWVAMVSDWVVRLVIFETRFIKGKWKKHKVI